MASPFGLQLGNKLIYLFLETAANFFPCVLILAIIFRRLGCLSVNAIVLPRIPLSPVNCTDISLIKSINSASRNRFFRIGNSRGNSGTPSLSATVSIKCFGTRSPLSVTVPFSLSMIFIST